MYSQPLVLFLKMKKKKKRKERNFLLNDSQKPAEKKGFHEEQYIFFLWDFFCFCLFNPAPHSPPFYHPWRGHRMMKGLFCIPYRVALWPWICPINDAFNTGRDSVDSPSGCKVKTLMYSTFANELQKLFFCFNSLLIDSQQLCVFIMRLFCIFMCEKNTQGPRQFEFQLEKYMRYIM